MNTNNLYKMNEIRLIKNSSEINNFYKKDNILKNKIENILFENIDQSRLIFKKIQLFGQLIIDAVEQNTNCQKKLSELNKKNVNLKTALAEIEIRNQK